MFGYKNTLENNKICLAQQKRTFFTQKFDQICTKNAKFLHFFASKIQKKKSLNETHLVTRIVHIPISRLDLEWMLAERGAIITELESDPRKEREIRDVMKIGLAEATRNLSDDDD